MQPFTRRILICVVMLLSAGLHCSVLKNSKFCKHLWVSLVFITDLWSFPRLGFIFTVLDASKYCYCFFKPICFSQYQFFSGFSAFIIATDVKQLGTARAQACVLFFFFKELSADFVKVYHEVRINFC